MKRSYLPLAVFILLLGFLGLGLRLNSEEIPSVLIGKQAPAFSLPKLNPEQNQQNQQTKESDQLALNTFSPEQLKGQVWLLNVWASWCTSCRTEHPVLLELSRKKLLPMIGLNYMDQSKDAQDWLLQFGNPYQLSVQDTSGKTGTDYGVYGVPETFLIDQKGVIRLKHIGPVTMTVLQEKLLPKIQELKSEH